MKPGKEKENVMMNQPDILIFMSDQHSPVFSGWGRVKVDTPNLDRMREAGTSLEECYTSCPLCVPARMSMLAAKMPDKTGVYTNSDTLSDMTPTFLHPFVEAGYETVLIGRMHFIGHDQRHGFTKRLAGDITPVSFTRPTEKLKQERGVFCQTFGEPWCLDVIGGGESPVQHYDQMVVDTAVRYLEEPHEKPQLIVVGTYAPHFPYVAPKELYRKYKERAELPVSFTESFLMNPLLEARKRRTDGGTAKEAMAAYCGMIERMDSQIGMVRDAFFNYAKKRQGDYVFGYLSDHGDQVGAHKMFGKQTFFEKSAKIPMIMEGSGILAGQKIGTPTSILDLGSTLCGLAGVRFDVDADGRDLAGVLTGSEEGDQNRIVYSQFMEQDENKLPHYGAMARFGRFKYISYHGYENFDMMFDLNEDPEELHNVKCRYPEEAERLKEAIDKMADPRKEEKAVKERILMTRWMMAMERAGEADDLERWKENPESARGIPKIR